MRTLLIFSSTTCIPCKLYKTVALKEYPKYANDCTLKLIDADTYTVLKEKYSVFSVPTSILEEGDRIINAKVGAMTAQEFNTFMEAK